MTIPNLISMLRLILVPAVVYALLEGETAWALAGFIVAGVSDAVDGLIARRWPGQRSELGAWLDPLADKALLVSLFVVLGLMREVPLWLVIGAISRDIVIMGAVLLADLLKRPVAMRPLLVSKANTAAQLLLIAVVQSELALGISLGDARWWLVALAGALTAASAAAYLVAWLRHMSGYGEGKDPRG